MNIVAVLVNGNPPQKEVVFVRLKCQIIGFKK